MITFTSHSTAETEQFAAGFAAELRPGEAVQFVRMGYYTPDSKESGVFNRIIPLKDGYRPG